MTPVTPEDLINDRNPSGIKIGLKPRGVRRISPIGLVIAGAVLAVGVGIGVLAFNTAGPTMEVATDKAAPVAPPKPGRQDWYATIPDTRPMPPASPAVGGRPSDAIDQAAATPASAADRKPAAPITAPAQKPAIGGTHMASTGPVQTEQDPEFIRLKELQLQAESAPLAAGTFQESAAAKPAPPVISPISPKEIKPSISIPQQVPDDPNLQDRKDKFLSQAAADQSADYNPSSRLRPISPYEIKAGSILPAIMIGGINSDLPGQITAQVRENVYDTATGRFPLIPQGSRLIGRYDSHVAYGQERVLVSWQRIIFPDASYFDLHGMPGGDVSGYAGFTDEVDNHYLRIFGASILMSAITTGVEMSQPQPTNGNSITYGQTATAALGQQLGQTGAAVTQKNLNIQPTINIRPGYLFNIVVTSDLVLPPDKRTRGAS